jgi:hypothetical protein
MFTCYSMIKSFLNFFSSYIYILTKKKIKQIKNFNNSEFNLNFVLSQFLEFLKFDK